MWLTELIKQHEEFEAPISFWYWSGLTAISAVAKDNIWLDRYLYKLYPNIYVMLHARSGLKKGPPVSMAYQLVHEVNNTNIISGRFSIQGLLKKMSGSQSLPGGHIKDNSTVFVCSSEMSSALVEDKAAMDIFTDLYDRHYRVGEYESILKMETFLIKKPTVVMLTATNEAHSEEFFQKKDVQGGYIARTFIIYENKRHRINSLAFQPATIPDYKKSSEYLKQISRLRGPFEWPDISRKYYDEWYHDFSETNDKHDIEDPTGTLSRFGDSVLKVAMLIALAEKPELELTLDAIEKAIKHCEKLVGNVRRTTMGTGKNAYAMEHKVFLLELVNREPHIISREMLNKKFWQYASAQVWDEIALSLEAQNAIIISHEGGKTVYTMPDKIANQLKDYFKEKT